MNPLRTLIQKYPMLTLTIGLFILHVAIMALTYWLAMNGVGR